MHAPSGSITGPWRNPLPSNQPEGESSSGAASSHRPHEEARPWCASFPDGERLHGCPFCLWKTNPAFSNARTSSFAVTLGSRGDTHHAATSARTMTPRKTPRSTRLRLGNGVAICGQRFDVDGQSFLGVMNGGFICLAPGLAARQGRKIGKVAALPRAGFDGEGISQSLQHGAIVAGPRPLPR